MKLKRSSLPSAASDDIKRNGCRPRNERPSLVMAFIHRDDENGQSAMKRTRIIYSIDEEVDRGHYLIINSDFNFVFSNYIYSSRCFNKDTRDT